MSLRLVMLTALSAAAAGAHAQGAPAGGGAPAGSGNVLNPMAPPGGMTDSSSMGGPGVADQIDRARREARGDRLRTGSATPRRERARPATAAEIVAGAAVADSAGIPIGTIESVAADGAVILSGTSRVRIPLEAFGRNSHGLLLGITKAEFDQAAASAS